MKLKINKSGKIVSEYFGVPHSEIDVLAQTAAGLVDKIMAESHKGKCIEMAIEALKNSDVNERGMIAYFMLDYYWFKSQPQNPFEMLKATIEAREPKKKPN